ncbi:chitobiase/beta-hexosaminidase C-terminal domain-containing protein [candidate division KSB1 bacterium]|nr:chitobiase/beta-hexosaminidase C-terminal domain-containing protein [candidate division KSB1 bacterium]
MKQAKIITFILLFVLMAVFARLFSQELETNRVKNPRFEIPVKAEGKKDQILKLSTGLNKLFNLKLKNKNIKKFAIQSDMKLADDKVVATILPKAKFTIDSIDLQALTNFGVTVQAKATHSMRVEIPVSQLKNVATKVAGIAEIHEPIKPSPCAITSEGVALMSADTWQAAGFKGAGTKVAIIDGGFNRLTAAQGNGDISSTYVSHDFSGTGLQTGIAHGTAVAEAVYDVAPQSQLYLYKVGDGTDLENAKDACVANSVHVINMSAGYVNYGGYYSITSSIFVFCAKVFKSRTINSYNEKAEAKAKAEQGRRLKHPSGTGIKDFFSFASAFACTLVRWDGTGIICDIANDAISNGIVWVNGAGNHAKKHYRGTFNPDANDFHDYGGGSTINSLGSGPTDFYKIDSGKKISIFLNWNNYPTTTEDYDLYLVQRPVSGGNWTVVAQSTWDQSVGPLMPQETINYVTIGPDTISTGMNYGIIVHKYSATSNADFTLFCWEYDFGQCTNSSSLMDPVCATDVVSVGAIDRINYEAGPQESFSSQGPTTDGRIKPDVTAPDNCNSFAYDGSWYGTSLSAPHTARVCALIKSRYPEYSDTQIKNYLYTNCTVDLGDVGKDNIYGWGKVVMPGFAENISAASPNGAENWNAGSNHDITWNSFGTSGNVKIELTRDGGANWETLFAGTPDDNIQSWLVTGPPSANCLVKITDVDGAPSHQSEQSFSIHEINAPIFITAPAKQKPGSEFWVEVEVGSNIEPVTDMSAAAFELFYTNTEMVDYVSDESGSFITGAQKTVVPEDAAGKISASVYRTDGIGDSGNGVVLRIKFKLLENATLGETICFSIGSAQGSDKNGTVISLTPAETVCTTIEPISIVATPNFEPSPNTYTTAQDITISCTTTGATIHYSTNGADPTETDPTYTAPINISTTTTLKVRAYKTGWTPSSVASGIYTITGTVATPTFNPAPGSYTTAQNVTISCVTPAAAIHYTTNGSDPTESDVLFTTPISISTHTTIKARAYLTGWVPSNIAQRIYTFGGTILGRVVDYNSSDPLQGVHIISSGDVTLETATDQEGLYVLSPLSYNTQFSIRPQLAGIFFDPASRDYAQFTADLADQDFTGSYYGDVDGNDQIQPLDASSVLRNTVGILDFTNPNRDSIAADVSGNAAVKSLDASYILRYISNLITSFPVEQPLLGNKQLNISNNRTGVSVGFITQAQFTHQQDSSVIVPIEIGDFGGKNIFSADIKLAYNPNILKAKNASTTGTVGQSWGSAVYRVIDSGKILIAMAGIQPLSQSGILVNITFDVLGSPDETSPLTFEELLLNEGDPASVIQDGVFRVAHPSNIDMYDAVVPTTFALHQNFPNPFNPVTTIRYDVPLHSNGIKILLIIYDIRGKHVQTLINTIHTSGSYEIEWDGRDETGREMSSGIYLFRLCAGNFIQTKKMILVQ